MLLNPDEPNTYLKYSKIPFLSGKSTNAYHRSSGEFLFCERDPKQSYLQFSALQVEKSKNYSNTQITCSGNIKVKEAIEFERYNEKYQFM